jgi:sec-independent protein translocase protein TatC
VVLFYSGCAFAYFLVLPAVFHFLTTFSPDVIADHAGRERLPGLRAGDLLRRSFELPVAMVILVLLGWVSRGSREARGLRHRRHLHPGRGDHPPDVVSQLMLAIPMCLLYEAGHTGGHVVVRSRPGSRPG